MFQSNFVGAVVITLARNAIAEIERKENQESFR